MPELPEVETTVRSLLPVLLGNEIVKIEILRKNMVEGDLKKLSMLKNQKIHSVERRGKYILIHLKNDETILIHLRMSGRLGIRTSTDTPLRYERFHLHLRDSLLVFNDARTLGKIGLYKTALMHSHGPLKKLGPDALIVSKADFLKRLATKRGTIKPLLLNQSFLAGIGNIYADEALFLSKIDPRRKAETLTKSERTQLHTAIHAVLKKGIKNLGTSFSDFTGLHGKPGKNQKSLNVYGRGGKPCFSCATVLKRIVVGQRGTVFCPNCQK